jgi:hypothetical protein
MGHGGRGRNPTKGFPVSERAQLRGAVAPAMRLSVSHMGNKNARDIYSKRTFKLLNAES